MKYPYFKLTFLLTHKIASDTNLMLQIELIGIHVIDYSPRGWKKKLHLKDFKKILCGSVN